MPDAIVLLKQDHQSLEKLFRQFEGLGDRATTSKRRVVDQILAELDLHTAIEEELFYPAVRSGVTDEVLEGYEEHHVVKGTMAELRSLDSADETFDAKVKVLTELVRHHVEEEEQDMFPKVRQAMGRKELGAIGESLETAKSTLARGVRPSSVAVGR